MRNMKYDEKYNTEINDLQVRSPLLGVGGGAGRPDSPKGAEFVVRGP